MAVLGVLFLAFVIVGVLAFVIDNILSNSVSWDFYTSKKGRFLFKILMIIALVVVACLIYKTETSNPLTQYLPK